MTDRYRWVILAAGTTAQTSFSAMTIGLAAIAPQLRAEYHLSLGEIGVVLGASSLGMILTLLPWGLLSDRIGERSVIAMGLVSGGVVLAATGETSTFWALVAALALAGALGASVNAASGRAVMGWFAEQERGLALGIRQTAVPIGGALAAVTLPGLVSAGRDEARVRRARRRLRLRRRARRRCSCASRRPGPRPCPWTSVRPCAIAACGSWRAARRSTSPRRSRR